MGNAKRRVHTIADFARVECGTTTMVLLRRCPKVQFSMPGTIFQNEERTHFLGSIFENLAQVWHRTNPKDWTDSLVYERWLRKTGIFKGLLNERKRVIFIDNPFSEKLDDSLKTYLLSVET